MRRLVRLSLMLVAFVFVAAGCTETYQTAITVGDRSLTHAELQEDVDAWADSPMVLQALGVADPGLPGRRSHELVQGVILNYVQGFISMDLLAEAGQGLEEADRETVRANAQMQPILDDLGKRSVGAQARLVEAIAASVKLQNSGLTFDPRADVYISDRYGTWDPEVGLIPPAGPVTTQAPLLGL